MTEYLLFENSAGFSIFKLKIKSDDVSSKLKEAQSAVADWAIARKMLSLVSFSPFGGVAHALENLNDISEGILSADLDKLIDLNIPSPSKKKKVTLLVQDKNLGISVRNKFSHIECKSGEYSQEMIRVVRFHCERFLEQMSESDNKTAQLGLGHAYSRTKVKFNVYKTDNHVIHAISLLDQLDKDVNTFSMRVKEWYSWHFPELYTLAPDYAVYAKLVLAVQDKSTLNEASVPVLSALLDGDDALSSAIVRSAKTSLGQELAAQDMVNIANFAQKVTDAIEYRKMLHSYLTDKMSTVAPNLSKLTGEMIGARLISHAGSMSNLAKLPASTLQILGAEKALFRALKTKGNTPKFGLLYHSSFIGKASLKNKGRVSRMLANKCTLASRVDAFSDTATSSFGDSLRKDLDKSIESFCTV